MSSSRRRTSNGSPLSTRACTPSSKWPATTRCSRRSTGRRTGVRMDRGAAARHSDLGEGPVRCRGRAYDRGVALAGVRRRGEVGRRVVGKLRAAGAVFLGKNNLAEFAADMTGRNETFGDMRNPWHDDYSAGGSSGGTASAVAAGMAWPVSARTPVARSGSRRASVAWWESDRRTEPSISREPSHVPRRWTRSARLP